MIDPVRPEVLPPLINAGEPNSADYDHWGPQGYGRGDWQRMGIISHEGEAITGVELAKLSDCELETRIQVLDLCAGAAGHKVRIVNA